MPRAFSILCLASFACLAGDALRWLVVTEKTKYRDGPIHCRTWYGLAYCIVFLCSILSGCGALPSVVILTDPLSGLEHFQLGLLHEKEGRFSSAVAAYRAAISQGIPADGELGNAHFQNGDFYAAERAYRVALHRHSDNGPILNNLAQTYLKRRTRLDEAELLVRQALLLDRRDPAAPYTSHYLDTLAALHAMKGQRMEARDGW